MAALADAFAKYQRFYVQQYVPSLIEDDPEDGLEALRAQRWDDPLRQLKPLTKKDLAKLVASRGPLPAAYVEFVTTVGVGPLLAAHDDEPTPFHVLTPAQIGKARKAALSWLSADEAEFARARFGIAPGSLLPFLAAPDWSFFLMLTRRDAADDGVVLFDHGHETGQPFRKPKPFAAFVKRWISCAKRRAPLNPFDGL